MSLSEFVSNFDIVYSSTKKNAIKLQGNRGYIAKRGHPAVIRYFLRYESEEEYYRALCILFLPFRDEFKEIHEKDVETLYNENEAQIENTRSMFDKNREIVELIRQAEESRETVNNEENQVEESDDEFTFEETTTEKDIANFEQYAKSQAVQSLSNYNSGLKIMEEDSYLHQITILNREQQKIFHDFCERLTDHTAVNPFYLYIAGDAGTGKSFVLRLMIEFMNRLPKQSGQELEKPYSITIAPTGVAAYLINGSTIESALGIQPQKKKVHLRNTQSRNTDLHFIYENLKVIFLDEVSMVGCDMLTKVNFRMQEIMGNNSFMGGVSMVATGDFGQLPPVGQGMIWQSSGLDGRIGIAPNHWDENFSIYYLREKMRSQDCKFSSILDKVRKGHCDQEVLSFMQKQCRKCPDEDDNELYAQGKLSIIVTNNADRETINLEKLNKLLPNKQSYSVASTDKATNVKNAPPVPKNIPLTLTGQLENQFVFKEGNKF